MTGKNIIIPSPLRGKVVPSMNSGQALSEAEGMGDEN
jgi:hypothetical protein